MARVLKVRPTKIELVRLQRRLQLSLRVKKILKDRLAILTTELIQAARRAITARQSRRQLARLDAAALRDIGISPEAARLEATRPIWDVPANWRR